MIKEANLDELLLDADFVLRIPAMDAGEIFSFFRSISNMPDKEIFKKWSFNFHKYKIIFEGRLN